MEEAFASLLGSTVAAFFITMFLLVFDVINERVTPPALVGFVLVSNAAYFTILFFIIHFKILS